tara:strand:- start:392 stop:997 length:606 start_codon:yes stop_codon:yes gene_type:complete
MIYYLPEKSQSNILKVKQSKFISYLRMCNSLQEFKSWLSQVKRDHYDSSHVCWAYAISRDHNVDYHCSDGGEPSGTAGQPILNIIKRNNLIQSGLVVVRYFGGVKLGKKGLIDAYGIAANSVILITPIIKWLKTIKYIITFPMDYFGEVYDHLSKIDGKILEDISTNQCIWIIEIHFVRRNQLIQIIRDITKGFGKIEKIE